MGCSHIGGMLSLLILLKIEEKAEIQEICPRIFGRETSSLTRIHNTTKTVSMDQKNKNLISFFALIFSKENSVHSAKTVKESISSFMIPCKK